MLSWLLKNQEKTIRIADNTRQYNFYVKHQPEFLDTSTNLNLVVYTSKKMTATVPCAFRWYRIRNGLTTQAYQFKGSSLLCQPSDVGSIIQAEIISKDNEHSGTAIIQFGPVKLDMVIRRQIEGALKSNSKILLSRIILDKNQKQCQLRISSDKIKIIQQNYTINFEYTLGQPRFQSIAKDPTRINIIFTTKYQDQSKKFLQSIFNTRKLHESLIKIYQPKIELKFPTRAEKDIFLFIIKGFSIQGQLKNALIINQMQKMGVDKQESFNFLMEISTLKQDISQLDKSNKQLQQQRDYFKSQTERLKQQLNDTVQLYNKLNSEIKKRNFTDQTQNASFFREKSIQLNTSNNKLFSNIPNSHGNDKLRMMLEQVDQIRVNVRRTKENALNKSQTIKSPQKRQTNMEIASLLDKLDDSFLGKEQFQHEKVSWQLKIKNITYQKEQAEKQLQEAKRVILQLRGKLEEKNKAEKHGIKFTYQQNKIKSNPEDSQFSMISKSATEQAQWQKKRNHILIQLNQKLRKENESQKLLIKSFQRQREHMKGKIEQANNQSFIFKEEALENCEKLRIENEHLNQTISKMKHQDAAKVQNKYIKKIKELEQEIEIMKRNQDAFNRSQHISLEMDNYNEEQLKIFKEQNEILTVQNQKLVKFCQKYKTEAKECGKLRQQLIMMKAKTNARFLDGFDKSFNSSKSIRQ